MARVCGNYFCIAHIECSKSVGECGLERPDCKKERIPLLVEKFGGLRYLDNMQCELLRKAFRENGGADE